MTSFARQICSEVLRMHQVRTRHLGDDDVCMQEATVMSRVVCLCSRQNGRPGYKMQQPRRVSGASFLQVLVRVYSYSGVLVNTTIIGPNPTTKLVTLSTVNSIYCLNNTTIYNKYVL